MLGIFVGHQQCAVGGTLAPIQFQRSARL